MTNQKNKGDNVGDFWLFKKHGDNIKLLDIDYTTNIKNIGSRLNIPLSQSSEHNTRFDWNYCARVYSFFYDYLNAEKEIVSFLMQSDLMKSKKVLVETMADKQIILVDTQYFIRHWYELTCGLVGMGSLVVDENYKYLLEFTDDAYSMLYSNFKIKTN